MTSKRERTGSSEAANEQYFSAAPASDDVRREMTVTLRDYDATVQVSNGVFSAHRVDLGTSVLLKRAPELPETGALLDLGCGWGPIALTMAMESPNADVWAVDVNERALELTAVNAKTNNCTNIHVTQVDEASTPLAQQPVLGNETQAEVMPSDLDFDVIWSNPPIRVGKEVLHTLLMAWLPRLKPQGEAYLVVQKNLGSDSLISWLDETLGEAFSVDKYTSAKGYRIIRVVRG